MKPIFMPLAITVVLLGQHSSAQTVLPSPSDVAPVPAKNFEIVQRLMGWDEAPVAAPGTDIPERQLIRMSALPDEAGKTDRLVQVVEYDYSSGTAYFTTLDTETGKREVLKQEAGAPPLARDEEERVISLARTVPEVNRLYLAGEPAEDLRPVRIEDAKSPVYRHRIVDAYITGRMDAEQGAQILVRVDLTTRQIIPTADNRSYRSTTRALPQATENDADEAAPFAQGDGDSAGSIVEETFEQYFPIGATEETYLTAWRIRFGTIKHDGTGEILHIKQAEYRTERGGPWFTVLGDCRLAEIYVPYNNGSTAYEDIYGLGFDVGEINSGMLGPQCLGSPKIYKNVVARENHDAGILWIDSDGRAQRNQRVDLWALLHAGNYRYIMQYSFHADGVVSCLLGPTAHNLIGSKDDEDTTHGHVGCWRLTPVLGYTMADATKLDFTTVSHMSGQAGTATPTQEAPFNNGVEGGEIWSAENFTSLRITSKIHKNGHQPPSSISYDMVPVRFGSLRRSGPGMEWINRDTWVTRERGPIGAPRLPYQLVGEYAREAASLSDSKCLIWHQSGFIHRARDEDFGPEGYQTYEGSATVNYVGLMLKPRNLHRGTPLYPR